MVMKNVATKQPILSGDRYVFLAISYMPRRTYSWLLCDV